MTTPTTQPEQGAREGRGTKIHLNWSDEGHVAITDVNEDRFVLRIQRVVEACRKADRADAVSETIRAQLMVLTQRLRDWLSEAPQVGALHLRACESGLMLVAVQENPENDPELDDKLTELDVSIAGDPDLNFLPLNVFVIPQISEDAQRSFVDRGLIFSITSE